MHRSFVHVSDDHCGRLYRKPGELITSKKWVLQFKKLVMDQKRNACRLSFTELTEVRSARNSGSAIVSNEPFKELTPDELLNIHGGGDISGMMKIVAGTLSSGTDIIKTLILGPTIWGMARMAGAMTGYSK